MTDYFALDPDLGVVVRFQGGSNAGHTVKCVKGKVGLHMLPCGAFHPHVCNVIGRGVALDVEELQKDMQRIVDLGCPVPNLRLADDVEVVMPYHRDFDCWEEDRLGKDQFGSTKRGIAPFYSDKAAHLGFQAGHLLDDARLEQRLRHVIDQKNRVAEAVYGKTIDFEATLARVRTWRDWLRPFLTDVPSWMLDQLRAGKNVLLEAQLASMKDLDYGAYPMVTSTNTIAAFGPAGAGVPLRSIKHVTAVCKAYMITVGAGVFPTEVFDEEANRLREAKNWDGQGGEWGVTTGRPRRVGWFDCVVARFGVLAQGATEIALTVLDALGYLEEIPVCVAYDIDGKRTTSFPTTLDIERAKPIYEVLPGWRCNVRSAKTWEDLPETTRRYVEFIETQIGCPIRYVGNGPDRDELILRSARQFDSQ